jgi:septal ring factor EnvC (AmiA/AmiB activator)
MKSKGNSSNVRSASLGEPTSATMSALCRPLAAALFPNRRQASPPASPASEQQGEVDRLQSEVRDLQIAQLTSNEHADSLQEHLYRLSTSLNAEIRERQAAEEKLQKLVQAITQEKGTSKFWCRF